MVRRWLIRSLCLTFAVLGGVVADSGNQDPYSKQPRIIIQNGNIILRSGLNGNISFASTGQGTIQINGVDLGKTPSSVQSSVIGATGLAEVIRRMADQQSRINDLSDQVSMLEDNITAIETKMNRFIGTGQDKISNRALRRVMSKVKTLGDKVNTLTQLLTENECNSNPCRNGGTCVDAYNGFICNCPDTWEGPTCETDVNECARYAGTSYGCQNGATCINTNGGYSCNCPTNWHGVHCTEMFDDCDSASHQELCDHGTCINVKRVVPGQPRYRCICDAGWQKSTTTPACSQDIDECNGPDRKCSQNPYVTCINLPGSFHCGHCPTGYTGNGHSCTDINECEMNNGGCSMQPMVQCTNTQGSRMCGSCPTGYIGNGVQCTFLGVCSINRGGCHPLATCTENTAITGTYRVCQCPAGYIGNGEGLTGCVQSTESTSMSCAVNPCHHGTCQMIGQSIHCQCEPGYFGSLCDRQEFDPCSSSPCQNGGTCTRVQQTGLDSYSCICVNGYEGPTCSQSRRCGGFLEGPTGVVNFPEQGEHYTHRKSCAWVISVNSSKVVQVSFTRFSIGTSYSCSGDFLQLNDGATSGARVLGRYCRSSLKDKTITSTHNQLYFWFNSAMTVPGTGFALNWTAVEPACGGTLNISEYGAVNSPGYPGVYPNSRTCQWLVRVPIGKRIQFHFATLKLEQHVNCSYDSLKIYDGPSDRDPEIGRYCTTVTPPPLVTSGHAATLIFQSDALVQDTGFHITYSAQSSVQGCGGTLTNPVGTFSSPNFPDVYENNLNCEWLIRIHPNNRILLRFKEFTLESHSNCLFDYVEIFEGSSEADPLVGRYCGSNIPSDLFSTSNQIFIRFRTDNSLGHSGFKAEYKTICGGVYTERSGVLNSPYYPENYPARAQCIYDIRLAPGYLINVTFYNLQIEEHTDCRFDYLQVRDGNSADSPLIVQLCGSNTPDNIISTYNFLWMRFETDGSVQNKGFYAQYEAVEVGCGGVLTEPSGQIASPRHPDRYPHSIVCSWYLKAPPGFIVQISFTSFILEPDKDCRFDYVLIEEMDGTNIGRYCGSRRPPVITSMDNTLFVKFVADASVARDGFSANYQFLDAVDSCGGTYYQQSGVIRSPGFPNHYPHNAHCIWILQAPSQRQISLNITTFNIEHHGNCRYDFLEIRNGGYQSSPLVGRFCGTDPLPIIRSHSNTLRLEFRTDATASASGFEIYFDSTSLGCGGKLTSPRGTIVSPNYPQAYPLNADCEWLIQVSAGSIITLTIIDIDIEEHHDCLYDYIQIFDGNSENSKSLLRICNNRQNPGSIVSSGNYLLVRFRSDATEEAGGFQLAYQTLCNNKLTKRTGVIESPNFPYAYPHNHNCSWTIQAPNGNNISMMFSHLFMEASESCEADYVEILEVRKAGDYIQLGKFCGNTTMPPDAIETSSTTAIVRLVTDRSVTREGFRLEWRMKGCGGDISNKVFGNITSPNYPNGYPFATTCYWHISYPPDSRVELTIHELDLEGETECVFDYLRVYGGEDENSPRLLNICIMGNGSRTITSHGNHMVIKFNSDQSIAGRGFLASFKKVKSVCGGRFTVMESTIMSPNFPEPYNADVDCNWQIEVDRTHLVVLEFYDFELPESTDCTNGYLAVYDGNNSSAPVLLKHCGGKPEGVFTSTGNQMLVRLVADGNNVGKGFRAHYKTGCGQRLLADEGGEIMSPGYPNVMYPHLNCSWIIYTSNPDEKVSVIITHMFLPDHENCSGSSLRFLDGDMPDSPLISEFCKQRSPPPILSRGHILHVFLMNVGMFRATYGLASTHCGGSFTSVQGSFSTPGYPYNYDINMECVWIIEASIGNKVHLTFERMSLEDSDHCNKDYVEIHENDETGKYIGRYCGSSIPNNVTSAHKLWIKFKSDDVSTGLGFMAHYELNHGSVWNGTEGQIASPGYPLKHHTNDDYTWTVFVPSGLFVSVRFLDIGITSISNSYACAAYVQIFDGIDDQADLLGQFCGYQIPEPVLSTGSVVFIKYHALAYYFGSFLLRWNAVTESGISVDIPGPSSGQTCFEELQLNATDEVSVDSPNYPQNYPDELNCTYILRAPHYQHVELTIVDLQMEVLVSGCRYDRLEVYFLDNANIDEWKLNSTHCGQVSNKFLISPTNLMKLVFYSDKYLNYKGFHSVAKSGCGVRFIETNGVIKSDYIRSELIEKSRHDTLECEYYITVRSRRTIQISFEKFNVPSDSVCSTNYILLKNGGSSGSPLLGNGKYCGSNAPAPLETSSNEAYVKIVISTIAAGTPDFELRYSELSLGCGGHHYITEEMRYVEITSPNYPNPPSHDTECIWTVVSPAGTRMRMDFDSEFHMSDNCYTGDDIEFLEILDGGTELAPPLHRFCGHDQPSSVMSTGSALYLRYVTAVDSPQAGFKVKIGTAACGGTISSFRELIQSPNYPSPYGNSQECEWILKMKNGYHIVLQLRDFDTPNPPNGQNCSLTDFLEIRNYDAQGEVLGTFCGTLGNKSRTINIPSPQAFVKFKSNSARTGRGFTMFMEGNFDDGCGGYFEGTSGVITSPHYPNALLGSRDCYWRINAPEGRSVKITFQAFNLPKDETTDICLSSLRVFNVTFWSIRQNRPKGICGSTLPDPIESSTSFLSISFTTHGLAAGQGFALSYSTEGESFCGGLLPLPSGVISTPNFTIQEDSYVDCKWRVSGDQMSNQTVVFRFDVLDLPGLIANYCRDGVMYVSGGTQYYIGRYCGNYSSEVIVTSPFPSTVVRVVSALNRSFRGVHGTYNISNCGGVLNGEDVQFSSPGYPDGYPPNTDCHWIINVPSGETMILNIMDLRLEDNCDKDYLVIRNGYHTTSPVVGKFCGTKSPAPIYSTGNTFSVIFHTDAFGTAPGFRISSTEQQRGCGGVIHMQQGNITSPNRPSHYGNNVECRWIIEHVPGYVIQLEFIGRFDIEMDSNCDKDYLLIEEYENDDTWSVRAKKCGPSTPDTIISKSNKVRVTFHTNDRITGDGFYIKHYAICGGNFTKLSGDIYSPNYPDFYENNLNCTYTIGKPHQYISISFEDYFSLEGNYQCVYDFVQIYHRNVSNITAQGPYCGTEVPASRTLEGPVTISFVTDGSYTAHGFKAHYEILDCGAILTEPFGVVETPKTSNRFLNGMDCTWQIVAPPDRVIALRFSFLDLDVNYRCWESSLDIWDGLNNYSPLIGKICGNSTPIIKSTGNILTLRLNMRSLKPGKGFSAYYHMTYGINQGCGGTFNVSSGEIQSLDSDSDGLYEPNLDCSWLIIGNSSDKVLQLTFDRFDIEPSPNNSCINDYLELRDDIYLGSSLIGRYCGSTAPGSIITSGDRVHILFHSNDKTNKAGFKLRFQTVASPCGTSTLLSRPEPQTLTSPGYPNPYPINLRCKWVISRSSSSGGWPMEMVHLTFSEVDVSCAGDYIEINRMQVTPQNTFYNSFSKDTQPHRLCGGTRVQDVLSQSGAVIIFHSNSIESGSKGFSLTYQDASCNRTYSRDSGVITNSAFPAYYNSDTHCAMTITAPVGKTISLYFSKVQMYGDGDCQTNFLKVYDGVNKSAPLMATLCGYSPPDPVFSAGRSLFIESYMDRRVGLYHMNYMTTDKDRGCGGSIYANQGVISSPLYPEVYNRNAECSWSITVPGYHTVFLEFAAFILNSTTGCDTNYVEIYDGLSGQIEDRIARYCGNDLPGTHVSRANAVMVKFVSDTSNTGPGFLLNFHANAFLPDTSVPFIQRHPADETENFGENYLYLTDYNIAG